MIAAGLVAMVNTITLGKHMKLRGIAGDPQLKMTPT